MSTPIQPHSDATALLGQVHTTLENRDAVHVACFQVELDQIWDINGPACMLRINKEGKAVPTDNREKAVGILDPFIQNTWDLKNGDKVWLILFPGMIRSLSHYWEHEAFPPAPKEMNFSEFCQKATEEKESQIPSDKLHSYHFLLNIAEELELSLETLLEHAHNKTQDNDYYYTGNSEAEGVWLGQDFWLNYQNYTGQEVKQEHQNNFISCSC